MDNGEVLNLMTAGETSTLVLAGGYPAPDIRLFGQARLLILSSGEEQPAYISYQLSDFDPPVVGRDSSRKDLTVLLDEGWKDVLVSAVEALKSSKGSQRFLRLQKWAKPSL